MFIMDLSVILIVITIVLLSIILAAIGAYVVIHGSEEKESKAPQIDVSGQYAVVVKPARTSMEGVKPTDDEVKAWIATQGLPVEDAELRFAEWKRVYEETIQTIDDGDRNGTVTYRIEIGPKARRYCTFLSEDNFITREQIRNHAELLPPYVVGCDCRLLPKLPWENPGKAGWKAIVPENGKYNVPNWRQFA